MNIDNRFYCWQDDTIHAYKSLYLHCLSTKVPRVAQKLKYVEENDGDYS